MRVSLFSLGFAALALPALADEARVAVAANFTAAAEQLAQAFTAETGHTLALSFGATGGLYTQITQGAPFAVFLAADDVRPARAVADGLGVEGSVFIYAIGPLALYGPGLNLTDGAAVLAAGAFQHLAIADPATAPYGSAALATLEALGLTAAVESKLVTGENITQALQFVESGNAELGFVALSQVMARPEAAVWRVPAALHPPIRQDGLLLKSGADNPAAVEFIAFLQGETARAIIEGLGYASAE
jgi:molybdate transport system substrate-binding protein